MLALIFPFAGVFYPIETLPIWMQYVAAMLPPSYVFEGMRPVVESDPVTLEAALWGGGLAIIYLLAACWFFTRTYRHAVRTGLLARYSAERAA